MKKYILLIVLALFLLSIFSVEQYVAFHDGKLHLVICDVGQGDGIFIRTSAGKNILVDGGPDDKITDCLSNHMAFWDRTIDLMILTHPHADHLTGLITVLKRYTVMHYATEKVENPTNIEKELQALLAIKKLSATFVYSGDTFTFPDKTRLLTVWPSHEWLDKQVVAASDSISLDVNGLSVIELLSYGKFKALLTGDAGVVVENQIADQVGKIDILKVPHHGSKTGMSQEFLDAIHPGLAIISVGKGNRYGHPALLSLQLLKDAGIKTLRTDQNGEVEMISDGKTWSVHARK